MSDRNGHLDDHLHDQMIENITFLMEDGLSFPLACARLGRTPLTVLRYYARKGLPNPLMEEAS